MISQSTYALATGCVGNTAGFSLKQVFVYYALEPVRLEIDKIVTKIASRQFHAWIASFIGYQAGLLLSIPVVTFLGDLVWSAAKECISAISLRCAESFHLFQRKARQLPFIVTLALRTAAAASGYFIKCLFSHYAMPYVRSTLELLLPYISPILSNWFLLSASALILTPPVTFFIGDLLAFLFQELVFQGEKKTLLFFISLFSSNTQT